MSASEAARAGPAGPLGPIGVFDSGLGGLTVLRSLIDLVPHEDFVYFGDTGRFPYGPRPPEEVLAFALQIGARLVALGVRMLVVACNSASAVAIEALEDAYGLPVVGVIDPGVRAAQQVTRTGRVGVIATVGTIRSGAYQRAAARCSDGLELTCAACPGFVEFVEAGDTGSDQVRVLAERLLAPIREADVDTLVLGCTHYPLLARTISDAVGRDVVLVSSADETAFEVRSRELSRSVPPRTGTHRFATSGDVDTFRRLGMRFLGPEVGSVEHWCW